MKKRLWSLVLTLAMVLSFVPGMTVTADADDWDYPLLHVAKKESDPPPVDESDYTDGQSPRESGITGLFNRANLPGLPTIVGDQRAYPVVYGLVRARIADDKMQTLELTGNAAVVINMLQPLEMRGNPFIKIEPYGPYTTSKLIFNDGSLTVGGGSDMKGITLKAEVDSIASSDQKAILSLNNCSYIAKNIASSGGAYGIYSEGGTIYLSGTSGIWSGRDYNGSTTDDVGTDIYMGSYKSAYKNTLTKVYAHDMNGENPLSAEGTSIDIEINTSKYKPGDVIVYGVTKENASRFVLDEQHAEDYKLVRSQGNLVLQTIDYEPEYIDIGGSDINVTLSEDAFTYDGTAHVPTVTVTTADGSTPLELGTHYSVKYADNTNAGIATVTVEGIEDNGYTGTVWKNFTINRKALSDGEITAAVEYVEKDGSDLRLFGASVKYGEVSLEYEDPDIAVNGDKADVTFTLKGNYSGTTTVSNVPVKFVLREDMFTFGITGEETYNKAEICPSVTAKADGPVAGTDYTVTYTNNINAGSSATITVAAKEEGTNYIGSFNKTFTIKPKTLTVEWSNTVFAYDGSAKVPTATLIGVVEGDEVVANVQGAATDAREAAYTATLATQNLSGAQAGNYSVDSSTPFNIYNLTFHLSDGTTLASGSNILQSYNLSKMVYSLDWDEMPVLVQGLTAKLGSGTSVTGTENFKLIWDNQSTQSKRPNAGNQPFTVVFNGTIAGTKFENVPVTTGSVSLGKRFLELDWGSNDVLTLPHTGEAQQPAVAFKTLLGDVVTAICSIWKEDGTPAVSGAVDVGTYEISVDELDGADKDNYTIENSPNRTKKFKIETIELEVEGGSILSDYAPLKYGYCTWDSMPTLSEGITATLGGETCANGSFRLVWNNYDSNTIPAAGEQGYKVLFTGTLLGVEYEDEAIFTGTVTVSPREIKIGVDDCEAYVRENFTPELIVVGEILPDDYAKIDDEFIAGITITVSGDGTATPGEKTITWNITADQESDIADALAPNYTVEYLKTATLNVTYNTCRINYVADNGTGLTGTDECVYMAEYTLPENPFYAAKLYYFKGWKIGDSTTVKQPSDVITVDGDLTITAIWDTVVVTDDADTADLGAMLTYDQNTGLYTLPGAAVNAAPENALFRGWMVNGDPMSAGDEFTVTEKNLSITHDWEYPVSITIAAADGSERTNEVTAPLYYVGDRYTLPAGNYYEALAGLRFVCWSVNGVSMAPEAAVEVTGDLVIEACWEKLDEFTVRGKVVDMNTDAAVAGATVEVWLGSEKVDTTTTDAFGFYAFDATEPGTYNIVVTAAIPGTDPVEYAITTVLKEIDVDGDAGVIRIDLGNVEVKLDVDENTPTTVVGGLDAEAQVIKNSVTGANSVKVEMTVEAKEPDAETKELIEEEARGKSTNLTYIDIDITKLVLDSSDNVLQSGNITETSTLLKIVIDFDTARKNNFVVYRDHEGVAHVLTTDTSAEEYIVVGTDTITIYAKKFSTYAIGYTVVNTGGGYYPPAAPSVKPVEPEDDGECKRDNTCPSAITLISAPPHGIMTACTTASRTA